MFCSKCGREIDNDVKFCQYCGSEIIDTPELFNISVDTEPEVSEEKSNQELTFVENNVNNDLDNDVLDNEEKVEFVINDETSKKSDSSSFNRKKITIIIGISILVLAVVVGLIYFFVFNQKEYVPRDPTLASEYFEKKFGKLADAAKTEDYKEYFEIASELDDGIELVFKNEESNSPYPLETEQQAIEAKSSLENSKIQNGHNLLKFLSEKERYEDMVTIYTSSILTVDNVNEVMDMMIKAFMKTGDTQSAEKLVKEQFDLGTEDAVIRAMKYQEQIYEDNPDAVKLWKSMSNEYDRALRFQDGFARVGSTSGVGDNETTKWGLIDSEGKEIVKPQYDTVGIFLEQRALVEDDGKWGFIDTNGKLVIDTIYNEVKEIQDPDLYEYAKRDPDKIHEGFYDGFAPVRKGKKWGYIDVDGNVLGYGFIYDDAWYFNEGVATVKIGKKYGRIDTAGNYLIEPGTVGNNGLVFDVIRPLYEGLSGVNWNDRENRGIINKDGYLTAIFDKDEVDLIQDFREGLASARKTKGSKEKWGFVDRTGEIIIPIKYDEVTIFIDGVSKVRKGKRWGLINLQGNTLVDVKYDSIGDFNDGVATLKKDKKHGFVSSSGDIITKPKYEDVTNFSDGFAGVKSGSKWGVINEKGEIVVQPIFEDMKEFSDGLSPVKINGKWGYIDTKGYFVITPEFKDADPCSDGLASVSDDKKYYYIKIENAGINLNGEVLNENNEAMPSVIVRVYKEDDFRMSDPVTQTLTNAKGIYNINVPEGDYKLMFYSDGCYYSRSFESVARDNNNFAAQVVMVSKKEDANSADGKVNVANALNGEGLVNADVKFRRGYNNTNGGYISDAEGNNISTTTDDNGSFIINLPCGLYTAEVTLDGYATVHINFPVGEVSSENEIMSKAMTEELPDGETRITLEWGANPPDLDSHLVGPSTEDSVQFHVFYPVKGEIISDSMLDKDDVEGNGFETTTIYNQHDGKYIYSVFDYTNGSTLTSEAMSKSGARVKVYRGDICVAIFDIPTNKKGNLWQVFEIDGDTITPINNVTAHNDIAFYMYESDYGDYLDGDYSDYYTEEEDALYDFSDWW